MRETDIGTLAVQLVARAERLDADMKRAVGAFERRTRELERRQAESIKRLNSGWESVGDRAQTALAGVGLGLLAREAKILADEYTNIRNTLRVYEDVLGDVDAAQVQLLRTSNDARAGLTDMTAVLGPAARAARDLGRSGADVFAFGEAVGKGAAIANTGATAVSGALVQLGQAIASPRVQLGEFNSIIEGTPRLAQAFAEGVLGAGGTVAQLRKEIASLSGPGITGAQLFEGLLTQLPKLRQEFERSEGTIESAFTLLRNNLTASIGEFDEATGASRAVADAIRVVADNIDLMAAAAIVGGAALAGMAAGQAIVSITAYVQGVSSAIAVVRALSGATATATAGQLAYAAATRAAAVAGSGLAAVLGGPVGIAALLAAAAAAALLFANDMDAASAAAERQEQAADALRGAVAEYRSLIAQTADDNRDVAESAREAAAAMIDQARATLALARAEFERRRATRESAERSFGSTMRGAPMMPGQQSVAIDAARMSERLAEEALRAAEAQLRALQSEPTSPVATTEGRGVRSGGGEGGGASRGASSTRERDADALAREMADLDREILEGRREAADTLGRRQEIELDLLALAQAQARAAIERRLAAGEITATDAAILRAKRDELDALESGVLYRRQAGERSDAFGDSVVDDTRSRERLKETVREAWSGGVRAAIDGDLGGYLADSLARAADGMFDRAADKLFDIIWAAGEALFAGGGSDPIGAILGTRDAGGSVQAGRSYLIGGGRPEVFTPGADGWITPLDPAVRSAMRGSPAPVILQTFNVYADNSIMTEELYSRMRQEAQAAESRAVATAARQAPGALAAWRERKG